MKKTLFITIFCLLAFQNIFAFDVVLKTGQNSVVFPRGESRNLGEDWIISEIIPFKNPNEENSCIHYKITFCSEPPDNKFVSYIVKKDDVITLGYGYIEYNYPRGVNPNYGLWKIVEIKENFAVIESVHLFNN